MRLPKADEAFLEELGLPWRVEPDGPQAGFLIIENFDVRGGGFAPSPTTLMIRIPELYNTTPLDMWYCDPPILRSGVRAPNTDQHETYMGRSWQRFSRHFPPGTWKPGRDGLRALFVFIFRELQGKE